MQFIAVTDTSGNLPTPLAKEYDLKMIPFAYFIDGERFTCLDTESFDGDAFYALLKNTEVKTTQINPAEYADFFEPFLKDGKDVIYVAMSSGISGSCQSASIGAQMLLERYPDRTIEVVDTRGASLGEGLVAVAAAKMRDEDLSAQEAAKRLRMLSERMFNVFTVNDLMFLRRGGRLSNLSAIVGTVLGIKPILKGGEDGQISAFDTVRSRKRSVKALASQYEKYVVNAGEQTIGIAHAACREDAEMLIDLIKNGEHPPKDILLVDYEPVTGAHVGPGALALFFESCEGVRAVKGLDVIPEKVREFFESARERISAPKQPVHNPAHI
ncbi:MAG: DegV family protein [Clostridia bacterium]|nr:DegV family protein [Clostridia bacterium]